MQKTNPDARGLAQEIMDMEMGLKERKAWTRDDFRLMINQTFSEYYGKFRDQFNPDEYMQCVDDEELVKRFNAFLERSEDNMITQDNVPWLDLGDIPSTHSFMRSESQQVYYVPRNRNPELVYVRYSAFRPKFHTSNPKERFEKSALPRKEVTLRDFTHTTNLCSLMMKNYRGKILLYDMIGYGTILFGLLIIILLGVGTSGSESGNWGNMVLYILLYFIFVPIVYKVSKCFQCKYLRQAHFVLAVVCRAENNRYYLRRGVEVRPGYLARWIEFSVVDTDGGKKDVIQVLRDRHVKSMEQTKKNVEADHQRYMEGVNRDINSQAIELRIQIEQAKKGRELTDEEKQDIVNAQLARPVKEEYERGQGDNAGPRAGGQHGMPEEEESSGSVSSDWDDWQDP